MLRMKWKLGWGLLACGLWSGLGLLGGCSEEGESMRAPNDPYVNEDGGAGAAGAAGSAGDGSHAGGAEA
jgi:hypothetical protein